ncbi:MAG: histidinol-phosphate transaminase [Proteobacteria bacterium]|nr:histidinol-phosphate transaminase [Pseudomonadota bacterium]
MSQFWSDIVHQLDPYVPGEQPEDHQYVKLNTNENPYPPSPAVVEAIQSYPIESLRRYPDPESSELRQALAGYFDLEPDQVFIGNGSDEVLAHSFQTFFQGRDPILFPDISYSFYPVYCSLYQIDYQLIALDAGLRIDLADYQRANGGVIFPNPNAPTGIALSLDAIRGLLENTASVVMVDEAYVDFGAASAISLIADYPNLLVIQTFSKSRSLAGLRLGYALGQTALIEGLNRVKNSFNSYPVDRLASAVGIACLKDEAWFQRCRERIMSTRDWLETALTELAFKVYPSSSNFLFVQHASSSASALYAELKQAGILVRYFKSPRIDNCLRISIGSDEECHQLVDSLKLILNTA